MVEEKDILLEKAQAEETLQEKQKQIATKLAAQALPDEEIDLRELQIKLEKIKAYVKRTEARIAAQTQALERLRAKRLEMENKRLAVSVVKVGKHNRNI